MFYQEAVVKVAEVEEARNISKISDKIKRSIISLWLHFFLKRIGPKHPDFLSALLTDINVSERQRIIIMSRYVNKLKFKEITGIKGVNCELRHVMREHKTVIDKLINI